MDSRSTQRRACGERSARSCASRGEHGQIAAEYLLILALGLLIILIGVTIALQLKTLSDFVAARTLVERNATIAMLLR